MFLRLLAGSSGGVAFQREALPSAGALHDVTAGR